MSETAILMAAGLGTRMLPLTKTKPKPLVEVNGKPMIETVIEGLRHRGVSRFVVVVGYLGEQFEYLKEKYNNLEIVFNEDYETVNNISSINTVSRELIHTEDDCFICEADLYVNDNSVFECELDDSCYFGRMVKGHSDDWVFECDSDGVITRVGKGGDDCLNMVGVSWFKKEDARLLGKLIREAYQGDGYQTLFWDEVVDANLDKLKLIVNEIKDEIVEIDTIEELKDIDDSYREMKI